MDSQTIIENLPLGDHVKCMDIQPQTTLFTLEKPVNLKTHPNRPGSVDKKALLLAPYDLKEESYLCEFPGHEPLPVYVLNRLDSPTSGLVLLCLDHEVARKTRKLFKERKVTKTYYAIVKGSPKTTSGLWKDNLVSKKKGEKIRTQKGGGRIAETAFEVLKQNKDLDISLLKLMPKTGFTHQLRVQSALHGCPIVGDKSYGDFAFNRKIQKQILLKRLCLHAHAISLNLTFKGEDCVFDSQASANQEVMDFF